MKWPNAPYVVWYGMICGNPGWTCNKQLCFKGQPPIPPLGRHFLPQPHKGAHATTWLIPSISYFCHMWRRVAYAWYRPIGLGAPIAPNSNPDCPPKPCKVWANLPAIPLVGAYTWYNPAHPKQVATRLIILGIEGGPTPFVNQ